MVAKIPLLMSDLEIGCKQYGFIKRRKGECGDDEDLRYQRHVQHNFYRSGMTRVRCYDAVLTLEEGYPNDR